MLAGLAMNDSPWLSHCLITIKIIPDSCTNCYDYSVHLYGLNFQDNVTCIQKQITCCKYFHLEIQFSLLGWNCSDYNSSPSLQQHLGLILNYVLFHAYQGLINAVIATVALIQKPINWFALQINWLVSMWGQHWQLMG